MITLQENKDLEFNHWVALRNESIGASEISPICFGSEYTSNLEIFYQKVTGIKKGIENVRTFIGRKSENIVDQFYPYYEGTDDSVHINSEKGRKLRTVENRNVTGRNSDFNHITATPDRFTTIISNNQKILTEYKNTQSHVLKKYRPGLPVDNVMQVLTQLRVFKYDVGELFYFVDNRYYESHPMECRKYKSQWQLIIDRTTPFWENVKAARILYNQMCDARRNFNMKLADEIDVEIQKLEPPVQYSDGYLKFINENYASRASLGGKQAEAAEVQKALKMNELAKKIKKLEKEKQDLEIDLKLAMKDAQKLDLGKHGEIIWQQHENRRTFKLNIKN
jgi:predicted phage-related endonuclease